MDAHGAVGRTLKLAGTVLAGLAALGLLLYAAEPLLRAMGLGLLVADWCFKAVVICVVMGALAYAMGSGVYGGAKDAFGRGSTLRDRLVGLFMMGVLLAWIAVFVWLFAVG